MRETLGGTAWGRCFVVAACGALLAVVSWDAASKLNAQAGQKPSAVPDLAGIWDGGTRIRPANSEQIPWYKAGQRTGKLLPDGTMGTANTPPTFPEVNERALAYMKVFDEPLSPKYDCQPATPPALEYDPYMTEIVQWPDRVLLRYEKDDQLRTVWLDGRQATVHDWGLQGFSVGRYEGNALIVETDHYLFDITGFDDYNGIPTSQQKKVIERYWREGNELKATITVEDPMFLRKPASYTTHWLPAPKGYKLQSFECDPESARLTVSYIPPRYK
jgi:hypothetical protein